MARKLVTEAGDFLLIYVSTPVEVCEARDRKGLYAKARAGLIKGFTGVSDPYEEPRDADLVLDTSAMTRDEAVSAVLKLLVTGGWLTDEPDETPPPGTPAPAVRLGPTIRRLLARRPSPRPRPGRLLRSGPGTRPRAAGRS